MAGNRHILLSIETANDRNINFFVYCFDACASCAKIGFMLLAPSRIYIFQLHA